MTIRQASEGDIPAIMPVLEAARGIMRSSGNMHQWDDGYPGEDAVLADIAAGAGYVVTEGYPTCADRVPCADPDDRRPAQAGSQAAAESDRVVAYFAFIPSPEPTYNAIYGGEWLDVNRPYHVIHRLGSLPDVHGVFRTVMDWSFSRDGNIRIDTHRDNSIMRHCIGSYGFTYCGIIYLASGDERLAYQKIICQR